MSVGCMETVKCVSTSQYIPNSCKCYVADRSTQRIAQQRGGPSISVPSRAHRTDSWFLPIHNYICNRTLHAVHSTSSSSSPLQKVGNPPVSPSTSHLFLGWYFLLGIYQKAFLDFVLRQQFHMLQNTMFRKLDVSVLR
jgi:hypothetical protein